MFTVFAEQMNVGPKTKALRTHFKPCLFKLAIQAKMLRNIGLTMVGHEANSILKPCFFYFFEQKAYVFIKALHCIYGFS